MFELYCQTFYPPHKTFAKKSVLSANKFVTLQSVNALYVRVETFAKQFVFNRIQYQIPLLSTIIAVNWIGLISHGILFALIQKIQNLIISIINDISLNRCKINSCGFFIVMSHTKTDGLHRHIFRLGYTCPRMARHVHG